MTSNTDEIQDFQDRGDAVRRVCGIDGTMGDAQDVQHPFVLGDERGSCLVCGMSEQYCKHNGEWIDAAFLDRHEAMVRVKVSSKAAGTVFGPYDSERETRREPMPREVSELHDAGKVKSGDPDRVVRDTVLGHLLKACEGAGVELGGYDERILAWLAGWDEATVQAVIGIISRAGAARKAG